MRGKEHVSQSPLAIRKMATRHLGIITQRVLHWHKYLPQSTRNHYDVEDMVSDVVMHVIAQSPRHDATRGKESTFVWWTADNKCKCILKFWQKHMRAGTPVEVEDNGVMYTRGSCTTVSLTDIVARTLPCVDEGPEVSHAMIAVECVIEVSSDAVLDVLELLLSGTLGKRRVPEEVISEIRDTSNKFGVTMDDFMRVIATTTA